MRSKRTRDRASRSTGPRCVFIPQEAVAVSGWALAPSGIRSIEATIDGEPRGRIVYGSLRADIGKRRHQYANADHCGFYGSVLLVGLPEGNHELVTLITANDGQQLELPTRIEIESGNFIDGGVPVINRHYAPGLSGEPLSRMLSRPSRATCHRSFRSRPSYPWKAIAKMRWKPS